MDKGDYEFMKFIAKQNRSYGTVEEFNFRKALFKKSLKFVEEWNARPGKHHTVGINHMSDWTDLEKKKIRGHTGGKKDWAKLPKAPKNLKASRVTL